MLCACGITSFLHPLPVVTSESSTKPFENGSTNCASPLTRCATGDLKVSVEDFVVVEIDPTGQRTDADPYVFPETDTTAEAAQDSKENAQKGAEDEAECRQNETSPLPNDCTVAETKEKIPAPARSLTELRQVLRTQAPALSKTFGSAADVAKRVNETFTQSDFTALIRDMQLAAQGALPPAQPVVESDAKHESASAFSEGQSDTSSASWWRRSHHLGDFADKTERQLIHLLLRRCFPHLRSYAEAPAPRADQNVSSNETVASVLSCAVDLHYVLFTAALGSEAAVCIARWAVAAQAARQERNLDDAARLELQSVAPLDESVAPASVQKGVCFASFDSLAEAMRRPLREITASENFGHLLANTARRDAANSSTPSSSRTATDEDAHLATPLLSDKDVRRHVHEALRRFYPFIRCQVRDGQVVLRYSPKPGPKTSPSEAAAATATAVSTSPASSALAPNLGARRPHEGFETPAHKSYKVEGTDRGIGNTNSTNSSSSAGVPPPLDFLHFIVTKRNLDTAEMRQLVGEYCGLHDGAVCAAGMKDKKAITTQRCSVPQMKPPGQPEVEKHYLALAAATPSAPVLLRWPADPQNSYAAVLCAMPRSSPVHLGQLQGNWFSVQVHRLRWATAEEQRAWKGEKNVEGADNSERQSQTSAKADEDGDTSQLRAFLEARFRQCVDRGFINYFGQQRFGETVERADDHTGVHLFAGRWVDAVRSLYRACPEVYDAFPDRMEARFVPGNSRDAQVMTHALRQTYRMYFSEHKLTRDDVQAGAGVWARLCEKAITEGTPYFLRSLWVHAGQSAFFNLAASFVVEKASRPTEAAVQGLPPLPYTALSQAYLPLGGYQVSRTSSPTKNKLGRAESTEDTRDAAEDATWQRWEAAAIAHAVSALRWTQEQAFEQRKVAGVPVPGSWRALVVRPREAHMIFEHAGEDSSVGVSASAVDLADACSEAAVLPSARLSFALPSSSYATIFLREVLGCDKWW